MAASSFLSMSLLRVIACRGASDPANCVPDVWEAPDSSLLQSMVVQNSLKVEGGHEGVHVGPIVTNSSLTDEADAPGNEGAASDVAASINPAGKKPGDSNGSTSKRAVDESFEHFSRQASDVKKLVRQEYEAAKERLAEEKATYQTNLTDQEERNDVHRTQLESLQKDVQQQKDVNSDLKAQILAKHLANQAARDSFISIQPTVDTLLATVNLNLNLSVVDMSAPELIVLSRQDAVGEDGSLSDFALLDNVAVVQDVAGDFALLQFRTQSRGPAVVLDNVAANLAAAVQERVDAIADSERESMDLLKATFSTEWEALKSVHLNLTSQISDLSAERTLLLKETDMLKKALDDATARGTDMMDYAKGLKGFASQVSNATSKYLTSAVLLEIGAAGKAGAKASSETLLDMYASEQSLAFGAPLMDSAEFDGIAAEMEASSKEFQESVDSMTDDVAEARRLAKQKLADLQANFSANLSAMDALAKEVEDNVTATKAELQETSDYVDKVRGECWALITKIRDIHTTLLKLQPSADAAAKFFAEMLAATSNDNTTVMEALGVQDAPATLALLQHQAVTEDSNEVPVPLTVANLSDVVVSLRRMDLETNAKEQELTEKQIADVDVRNKRAEILAGEKVTFLAELKAGLTHKDLTMAAKESLETRLSDLLTAVQEIHGLGLQAAEAANLTMTPLKANASVEASVEAIHIGSSTDANRTHAKKEKKTWGEWLSR